MPRKTERSELIELLMLAPAWFGPMLAAVAWVAIRAAGPLFVSHATGNARALAVGIAPLTPMIANVMAAGVLLAWIAAELTKFRDRRRLNRIDGIESIRRLPWQEFERLVAEAYRRQGFVAEVCGTGSRAGCGDGGVDVELRRPGEFVLVQCKHWKAFKVGVGPVRELLGVVASRGRHRGSVRGVLVTSGKFTPEARRFAAATASIELIAGESLAKLIASVQGGANAAPRERSTDIPSAIYSLTGNAAAERKCPVCGKAMTLRTARRGFNAGGKFWGCSAWPRCPGTISG